jgi:hypothetical protein
MDAVVAAALPSWASLYNNTIIGYPLYAGSYLFEIEAKHVIDENLTYVDIQKWNVIVGSSAADFLDGKIYLPSVEIDKSGQMVDIEITLADISLIADKTVKFSRLLNNRFQDYTFGNVLIDTQHNIAIVSGSVFIPENKTGEHLSYTIAISYYENMKEQLIYSAVIDQSNISFDENNSLRLSMNLSDIGLGYSMIIDEDGNTVIVRDIDYQKQHCAEIGFVWNNIYSVCAPTRSSPVWMDGIDCINSPVSPNQWDYNLNACFASVSPAFTMKVNCDIFTGNYNATAPSCDP